MKLFQWSLVLLFASQAAWADVGPMQDKDAYRAGTIVCPYVQAKIDAAKKKQQQEAEQQNSVNAS